MLSCCSELQCVLFLMSYFISFVSVVYKHATYACVCNTYIQKNVYKSISERNIYMFKM